MVRATRKAVSKRKRVEECILNGREINGSSAENTKSLGEQPETGVIRFRQKPRSKFLRRPLLRTDRTRPQLIGSRSQLLPATSQALDEQQKKTEKIT